jgi:hypothetical protein
VPNTRANSSTNYSAIDCTISGTILSTNSLAIWSAKHWYTKQCTKLDTKQWAN